MDLTKNDLCTKKRKTVHLSTPSSSDESYFSSYGDIVIHRDMIADDVRTSAYRSAILHSYEHIFGKVVLDVGAGTGILSVFCVQAGAKKVYAVEASSMAEQARLVVSSNNLQERITVIHGKIEEVTLPEKVDVIVSEWMGYMLLYESMLRSVLYARDKFLKPGGIMLPDSAKIFLSPISAMEQFDKTILFWDGVKDSYKVDMSAMKHYAVECFTRRVHIEQVEGENIMSRSAEICHLSLTNMDILELDSISSSCVFECFGDSLIHGFVCWFDVYFIDGSCLSTSPYKPLTHWQQSVIYIGEPLSVKQADKVVTKITLQPNGRNSRYLDVLLTFNLNSESERTIASVMDEFVL